MIYTLFNDTGISMVDMNDPDTTINVGISEFTMATMACGLASEGHRIICHAVTPHYLRAWEAVRTLLVPGGYDVALIGAGEGEDYSSLGHSHQMSAGEMSVHCIAAKIRYFFPLNKQEFEDAMDCVGPRFIQIKKGTL